MIESLRLFGQISPCFARSGAGRYSLAEGAVSHDRKRYGQDWREQHQNGNHSQHEQRNIDEGHGYLTAAG